MTGEGGVRLRALLGHPDWSRVGVLAGADPVDPTVRAVVAVPDLAAEPKDMAGALFAVVLSAPREDWHLDALLRRAGAAGVAAVLLPGTAPLQPASHALAARIGLPVLGAEDPLAATLAATRLIHQHDLVVADLVARTVAACASTKDTGVDALVADLARVWRRPVWLLDAADRVVAGPEPGPGGNDVRQLPVGADVPGARLAAEVPAGVPAEAASVTAALAVAVQAVGRRLAGQRLAVERDARLRMALLAEIVQHGGELPAGTRRRAIDAGWQLEGWHVGVRIDAPGTVDPVATRPHVLRAADSAGLRAVVVEQGSGWGLWSTFDQRPGPAELQRHASAARAAHWELRASLSTSMGVGRAHPGVSGLARTLGEAGDAARLAAGRSTGGHFVHVDRMGLGQMLLAWTGTDTFLPAATSLLEPLRGQPGDLLVTLRAFLDAESSLTETAAVLGVHRNTVAARIARVRDLLGVELTDPDERLALHLACRGVTLHG